MIHSTEPRLLLLTATIRPRGDTSRLVRADPLLRREDYRSAMASYAGRLSPADWSIAVVENSGSNLQDLVDTAAAVGHELRIIRSAPATAAGGKGNGEALMLDAAEQDIRAAGLTFRQVVKVTGRLIVRNLDLVVPDASGPHITARMHRDRSMADTRVVGFDQATWHDHLRGLAALVREEDDRYLEHAVALRIAEAVFTGPARWLPFSTEPDVSGVSGTDGLRYDSVRARVTRHLKNGLNRLPQAEYR